MAYIVNKYTADNKYANKVKFNVPGILEKLIFSTNRTNENYTTELIMLAFSKVAHLPSPGGLVTISLSYKWKTVTNHLPELSSKWND